MDNLKSEMDRSILAKSATSSFNWNLAGSVARYGAGFLINIVLARILGPEPYGIVAVALIFISIGNLIVDSGLNAGLVQKKEINNQNIHYVLTIQLLLAVVIGGLLIGSAPLIAKFYHQPAITPVLQILSISLLLQAASQVATGLLKRRLEFNRIQQAQVSAYLVGYLIVGLTLAYKGFGVWSLVYAQLVQSFLYLLIIYGFVRHSLGLVFHDSGGITLFGVNILGANIANWIISNYDNTSISIAGGPTNLGLYGRAWTLAMTPVGIVVSSAQSVLFSATSKIQESIELARDAFVGIFILFGITLFPFSLYESLVAHDLIQFIYGDKWVLSAPILTVLPLAMPFFALMALEGPVLAGLGKPQVELKVQWLVLGLTLIVFLFAIHSSTQIIVWSVFGIYVFRFLVLSLPTFRILCVSKHSIKSILLSIVTFTCPITLAIFITGKIVSSLPIFSRLLTQGFVGVFLWVLIFLFGWNHFLPVQVLNLVNHFIPKRFVTFFKPKPEGTIS